MPMEHAYLRAFCGRGPFPLFYLCAIFLLEYMFKFASLFSVKF
jgi:hypothetical protein